jgi:hypothetical protein
MRRGLFWTRVARLLGCPDVSATAVSSKVNLWASPKVTLLRVFASSSWLGGIAIGCALGIAS